MKEHEEKQTSFFRDKNILEAILVIVAKQAKHAVNA